MRLPVAGWMVLLLLVARPAGAVPATKTYDFKGITSPSTTHAGWAESSTTNPFDPTLFTFSDSEITDYTAVANDDTTYWWVRSNNARHFRFRFVIAETPATITALRPTWVGMSTNDDSIRVAQTLYIWNVSTSRWEALASHTASDLVELDGGRVTVSPANYVNASGEVYLFVFGDYPGNPQAYLETDYVRLEVEYEATGSAPAAPSSLAQLQSDGATALATGGTNADRTVVLRATASDPDAAQVRLAVEVQPLGVPFSGRATAIGAAVASGSTASATVSNLPGGPYHWQAWVIDETGAAGSAAAFGGNAETDADFVIPGAGCLASEHFDANAVGAPPAGWTVTADVDTSFTTEDGQSTTGTHGARIADANTSGAVTAIRSFTANTQVTVEFAVRLESVENFVSMWIDDADTASGAIQIYAYRGLLSWYGGFGSDFVLGQLRENTWHRVRVVADAATDTGTVFFDDMAVPIRRDLAFLNGVTDLSRFYFASSSNATGTVWFDDVVIRDGTCAAYAPPAAPTLVRPWDSARTPDGTFDLLWSVPASTGSYDFKVLWAEDRNFATGLVRRESATNATGFSPAMPLDSATTQRAWYSIGGQAEPGLENGKTYWWKVASRQAGLHSAWSEPRSVTIDTSRTTRDWFQTTAAQMESGGSRVAVRTSNGGLVLPSDGTVNWALAEHGSTPSAISQQYSGPATAAFDGRGGNARWASAFEATYRTPLWLRVDFGQTRTVTRFDFDSAGSTNTIPSRFQVRTYAGPGCTGTVTTFPDASSEFSNSASTWSHTLATPLDAACVELLVTCVTGSTITACTDGSATYYAWVDEFRVWNRQPATGSWTSPEILLADQPGATAWNQVVWTGSVPGSSALGLRVEYWDGASWLDSGLSASGAPGSLSLTSLGGASKVRLVWDFTRGSTPALDSVSVETDAEPLSTGTHLRARWMPDGSGVEVVWEASDAEVLGFDLLRALDGDPVRAPLNAETIPSASDLGIASYEWLDPDPRSGDAPQYWLVEHRLDGTTRTIGPVTPEPAATGDVGCGCVIGTSPRGVFPYALLAFGAAFVHRRRRRRSGAG